MNDEEQDDSFRAIKVPLKHIIRDQTNIKLINDIVLNIHKIEVRALLAMKMYLLDWYDNNDFNTSKYTTFPKINSEFVLDWLRFQCVKPCVYNQGRYDFYIKTFRPLIYPEVLHYTNLTQVLQYAEVGIRTMYKNNIIQNFVSYVARFVNVMYDIKGIIEQIKNMQITTEEKQTRIKQTKIILNQIKSDLLTLNPRKYKSDPMHHVWIEYHKSRILPGKKSYKKKNVYYDLKVTPFLYLPGMIYIMKEVETRKQSMGIVFPLKRSIIPGHITMDTKTILVCLWPLKHKLTKQELQDALSQNEDLIWKELFYTNQHCFKQTNFTFHHMIKTDGVSCSIMFRTNKPIVKKPSGPTVDTEMYVHEIPEEQLDNYKFRKIVGIDPGLGDLIYCVDGDYKDSNKFRYSNVQRRFECKKKKYCLLHEMFKKERIKGLTVKEHEALLSKHNHKTLNMNEYKKYIHQKDELNQTLYKFYSEYIFRKLKFNAYMLKKKSEQKMVNNFEKTFGKPPDVVVCFGDFTRRQGFKGAPSLGGKHIRNLLRQKGYEVFKVDEFRTSVCCSNCNGGRCEKYITRPIGRNSKGDRINDSTPQLIHGALKCTTCDVRWNRDRNGASNIYRVGVRAIHYMDRPDYLCR